MSAKARCQKIARGGFRKMQLRGQCGMVRLGPEEVKAVQNGTISARDAIGA